MLAIHFQVFNGFVILSEILKSEESVNGILWRLRINGGMQDFHDKSLYIQ